ncbi:MAG: serine-type D-Ala-D-Ala carboxypeptidase [Pseudomonadales bacterium]|jgi:serine-type D-Ala-D-Ala carboxypeptidase (penicillin-binding protein 5/6)|uniref:D-alanyl-D-alanine carboxypeptidase family protein n=1 Tax=unclassified Ketobacter TaxID=2639109 RepID=UPI000C4D9CCB|nr:MULTISPECIES: D-alanyl-D-alanine carboxypeptidase family protein [unclassified Ketobacter]MAQ26778.1 serine-type D-Ala-D-Ala carboxypeptidase [Pseudomonadales bacterium]MEC8809815.1 D-alanyl-D-alanine carboxypeptidase family protein [Pseudomonadota bacterium]TNC88183.1 MAG: serine-type D-Ala-D-Ala carboxypeptidase [Alcanivorax sp.]HAG93987.1 serine-type D-Ala-D-Ala carboxypeptidase [Gammaproteobacteria bacterium]MBI25592.1 serine-type D-Ala-D-Ala carboxypeptidase [Pseudomonadales bacterium]|tara:strand:- start:28 stop:1194 length:1167 start_codon:yes stop_codon:yes gene_type:complete
MTLIPTRFSGLCALFTALFLSAQLWAATPMIPAPPTLAAKSWLLMDAKTGYIITEYNADQRLAPASLTKMMTTYIASEQLATGNIGYDDMVRISEKAWRKGGSKMYIREGTEVKLEDLLRGVIIQSGNDASIAVAEYIAGSEDAFADLMNQTAYSLGMNNSNFVNATGWPAENHYTTARDLSLLARATINDHPEDYAIYSEKEFTYNNIRQPNRNSLLWQDDSVDGIKTGHTDEAGYCLVASAVKDDMRLISVVMGTRSEKDRAAESQKLITYGFRFYETVKSYDAKQELLASEIWKGDSNSIKLGTEEAIWLTIPRGTADDITADIEVPELLMAPIAAGEKIGTIQLTLNGDTVATKPLIALESVEEGGLFKRLWHWLVLMIKGLFS